MRDIRPIKGDESDASLPEGLTLTYEETHAELNLTLIPLEKSIVLLMISGTRDNVTEQRSDPLKTS